MSGWPKLNGARATQPTAGSCLSGEAYAAAETVAKGAEQVKVLPSDSESLAGRLTRVLHRCAILYVESGQPFCMRSAGRQCDSF